MKDDSSHYERFKTFRYNKSCVVMHCIFYNFRNFSKRISQAISNYFKDMADTLVIYMVEKILCKLNSKVSNT